MPSSFMEYTTTAHFATHFRPWSWNGGNDLTKSKKGVQNTSDMVDYVRAQTALEALGQTGGEQL